MDIYHEILSSLEVENQIILVTIISTSGSTPVSALSKMIIKNGGTTTVGTIGGGCMEGNVIQQAIRMYNSIKAEIISFNLNEDDTESGLICGGSLKVLIEPIKKEYIPIYQKIKTIRDSGEDCLLGTLLNEKEVIAKYVFKLNRGFMNEWIIESLVENSATQFAKQELHHSINPIIQQYSERSQKKNETIRLKLESGELILEPIYGTPSLIIFGGGHVSKFVSQIATMVGFRVTIVDDRENYANPKRFPEATQTLVLDFADVISHLTINRSTYIVIVTRGHRYDEIVLEQLVKTPAKYIGMIGSKRKVLTTYEHLRQRGITNEQLKKVHAPIGINIGAVTAEEIAVSIVAQIIHVRRGENNLLNNKPKGMKDILCL